MNIAVLIKQVPSSEARIKVADGGRSIDPTDVEFVINPYDEYAMEAALQAKEKFGGEVVAVSLGPARVEDALRTCLALGADRAVSLKDPAFLDGDSLGAARVLSAALRKLEAQVIFCGKVAIDDDNGAVGSQVAELLGWPHVSVVTALEWVDESHAKVSREIEAASEELEVSLPAVFTANKGLNEPRYPSLKGIMAAKKKPMGVLDAAALGVSKDALAGKTERRTMAPPADRPAVKLIQGDPVTQAKELIRLLHEEAKVI